MSTVTIAPGATEIFDPLDKRVIVFDFDQVNLAVGVTLSGVPTITITALQQNGASPLSVDNSTLLTGNRKSQARFLATTATLGDKYQVAVKGVTNETPPQEKNYSIFILVQKK